MEADSVELVDPEQLEVELGGEDYAALRAAHLRQVRLERMTDELVKREWIDHMWSDMAFGD